jgi:hypothetical protein
LPQYRRPSISPAFAPIFVGVDRNQPKKSDKNESLGVSCDIIVVLDRIGPDGLLEIRPVLPLSLAFVLLFPKCAAAVLRTVHGLECLPSSQEGAAARARIPADKPAVGLTGRDNFVGKSKMAAFATIDSRNGFASSKRVIWRT